MSTLCLTPEEIYEVTKKSRFSAQMRALAALGLEFKPRPDGSPLVDRGVYEDWLRGSTGRRSHRSDESERKTYPVWNS